MREEHGVGVIVSFPPFQNLMMKKANEPKFCFSLKGVCPGDQRSVKLGVRCVCGSRGWTGQTCPVPPGNSQPRSGNRPRCR